MFLVRKWVRGAVRIARQPSKLKVVGSNPTGPVIFEMLLGSVCFLFEDSLNSLTESVSELISIVFRNCLKKCVGDKSRCTTCFGLTPFLGWTR